MKRLFIIALMALCCTFATAQSRVKYDNNFKYSLFSNMEIGVAGVYSYQLGDAHLKNYGASLMLTKRIGDFWRLRGLAEVNGFKPNGFDRFGKGMFGVSLDLLPFYIFVDEGVVYNPSSHSRFGLALDGGAGLQFKLGDVSSIYIEGAVDRVNNGNLWQSNASVKAGFMVNTGVTETDRKNKSIDDNIHRTYGQLREENVALKSEVDKASNTVSQMEATLNKATALCEQLEQKLKACNDDKKEIEENCTKFMPIFFEYASAEITEIEEQKVALIADEIQKSNGTYRVDGYCSNNGGTDKNQILSNNRAWAVVFMLVDYGCDMSRFEVVEGHGKTEKYDSSLDQQVTITKIR